ncbi:AAA family ATPase [Pseudomonas sp. UL073]|uniref:AAA family ATPase n=1 Tax=Zestomonas insulae TaxID=2809017 RepID=A0ABS2IFI9_9GAMM|nr:AAA family ATPase [Pseudomonas insulae]MBM7060650.1 AAA family ATPase [Pseudomonas insulae]
MKKSLFARHRRLLGVVSLCLALSAAAGWYWQSSEATVAPPSDASARMLAELQQSTDAWTAQRRDLSTLVGDMRDGRIASAALSDDAVYVSTHDGQRYWLADQSGRIGEMVLRDYASGGHALFPVALFDTSGEAPWYHALLKQWPLFLLLLLGGGFVAWKLRPQQALKQSTGVRFADVIGAGEAKLALQDVTAYLRDPAAFATLGARPPKGVLLTGEPGTGKTQLAKALASECDAHFIQVTGSDFSSMYFGVGIHKVKSLFRTARKHAPCIIFIDEIDGIGRRGEQSRASDAEGNRIVNQFLTELDGFAADSGVLVLGATNFPNSLDPALVREGRFDRSIAVGLPSLAEREQLFRLYAGKITAADDVDHAQMARNSVGLTPAAIAYIVNHAALLAARSGEAQVRMNHFADALETCRIGEQPVGMSMLSEVERTRIAVHESGHAIVAAALNCGRVEKVTILPRGQALGVTLVTPVEDKRLHLESELRARIQMLLGGRVAEQLHFHEVSSGAGQDLHEASKLALSMVGALGMGPKGSLLSLQAVRDAHLDSDPREALEAADQLLLQLNAECTALLQQLRPALEQLSARLLEEETVAGEEVVAIVTPLLSGLPAHVSPIAVRPRHLERVAFDGHDPLFDLVETDEEDDSERRPGMV